MQIKVGGRYLDRVGNVVVIESDMGAAYRWRFRGINGDGLELTFDKDGCWGSDDEMDYDLVQVAPEQAEEECDCDYCSASADDDAEGLTLDTDATEEVLDEVYDERVKQDARWGEQNHHPFKWLSILTEEVGEVAMAANDADAEKDPIKAAALWEEYRQELIQVAAVAASMVESFDRNHG